MERVAVVGGGLAGFVAYLTLLRGGLDPEEIVVFGTGSGPGRGVAAARGGDPADAHALGERRALPAVVVPGARRARGAAPALARAARAQRLRPLPRDRAGLPRARGGAARRAAAGARGRRAIERITPVDGGFELDGHGAFRHVLARDRPSGHRHAGGAARRSARGARVRAARLRRQRLRRRRRARGGDGVAERARRRLDGDLGAAARAGAAAAERAASVPHAPRARVVPPLAAGAPRGRAARAARAVVSAAGRRGTSRSRARPPRDGSASRPP